MKVVELPMYHSRGCHFALALEFDMSGNGLVNSGGLRIGCLGYKTRVLAVTDNLE